MNAVVFSSREMRTPQGASRSTLQFLDLYHFTGTLRRRTAVFICRQAMAQLFVKFGRAEDRKGRRKLSGALSQSRWPAPLRAA